MEHLSENTRKFTETASNEDRIDRICEKKWIGYSNALSIGNELDRLVTYPKSARMPNILLVGESNNGKTMILNKFDQRHLSFLDDYSRPNTPVLMVQAPPEPDELRFYGIILNKLDIMIRSSDRVEKRQERVISHLRDLNVRVLVIDEIQHVLAGSATKQRQFLNVIKYLANELRIPIVCAGTEESFNAMQTDPQIANRFEPRILKKWTNDKEYRRLMASFESVTPLKQASRLAEGPLSSKILSLSEGLIGEMRKIIEYSGILAIESGEERITEELIEKSKYRSPSARNRPFLT